MLSRLPAAPLSVVVAFLAAGPAAAAPVQPINRVREIARVEPGTRVSIHGVVTRYRSGRSIYLQDQTGSIFVYTEGTERLAPGDVVDVTGKADIESELPIVAAATYRKTGTTDVPQPIGVTARQLALGEHDAQLVSLEGALVRVDLTRYETGFVVRADGSEFPVWILNDAIGDARRIQPASRVRVTGVVSIRLVGHEPKGFELLARNGADLALVQPPSWWTSRRIRTAAVTLAGVIALLLSYVVLLRRQVERQTRTIHERLRTEAELKEQYRQAQKMESIGRLAGGIAHDFNNIMTVVLGHIDVLAVELRGHPELMESVTEIQRAGQRAAAVTRQLLAFGRRQRLEPALLDLNHVVDDMGTLFSRVLGGEIEVRTERASAPVTIRTDPTQLEQTLLNLAVNARDAMPQGGRLTLSVSRRDAPSNAAMGVIKVTDTGSGIPPDVQPHIFDPFFTTKEVGQGSGLGLAMVYGFVQQTGGTIRFQTAVGVGTTFELSFPVISGDR